MALWTDVVDRFKGKKSLEKLSQEELDREKIKLDMQERKQITQTQGLERDKEKAFASGIKETSPQMKLYYARKVKEIDAEVRLKDRELRAVSHKIRIYNGIISVKKWMSILSEDKRSLLNKLSVAEITQWIEKNTTEGQLKENQLDGLLRDVEGGIGAVADVDANEEQDVQKIFEMMNSAPLEKAPEEFAKESMPAVTQALREKD